ncbi:hypothetical protein FACS1894202_00210 [Clostridia bacterium]|nr:hypothetical protein FACS1894202_00210 [Clostridia bacterium]
MRNKTVRLALLGVLTAIVVLLQFLVVIRFGMFQIAISLVPIVIGAALCGPAAGAWLGAVAGGVILLNGDAAAFLQINIFGTILTVLAKGALSGFCAGLAYKLLSGKNKLAAVSAAAVTAPLVNTGIFILGCYAFFLPTLREWGVGYANVSQYIFLALVGANFLVELAVNFLLSAVLLRLISYGEKRFQW